MAEQQPRPRAGTPGLSLGTRHRRASARRITETRAFSGKSCPGVLSGEARTSVSPLRNGIALVGASPDDTRRLQKGCTAVIWCHKHSVLPLGGCAVPRRHTGFVSKNGLQGAFLLPGGAVSTWRSTNKASEVRSVTGKPLSAVKILFLRDLMAFYRTNV